MMIYQLLITLNDKRFILKDTEGSGRYVVAFIYTFTE